VKGVLLGTLHEDSQGAGTITLELVRRDSVQNQMYPATFTYYGTLLSLMQCCHCESHDRDNLQGQMTDNPRL